MSLLSSSKFLRYFTYSSRSFFPFYVNGEEKNLDGIEDLEIPVSEYLETNLEIESFIDSEEESSFVLSQFLNDSDEIEYFQIDSEKLPLHCAIGMHVMTCEGLSESPLMQFVKSGTAPIGSSMEFFCSLVELFHYMNYLRVVKSVLSEEELEEKIYAYTSREEIESYEEFLQYVTPSFALDEGVNILDVLPNITNIPNYPLDMYYGLRMRGIPLPSLDSIVEVSGGVEESNFISLLKFPITLPLEVSNIFMEEEAPMSEFTSWNDQYMPIGRIRTSNESRLFEYDESLNNKVALGVGTFENLSGIESISFGTRSLPFEVEEGGERKGFSIDILGGEDGSIIFSQASTAFEDEDEIREYYEICLRLAFKEHGVKNIALYVNEHYLSEESNIIVETVRKYLKENENELPPSEDDVRVVFCFEGFLESTNQKESFEWSLLKYFPRNEETDIPDLNQLISDVFNEE